MADHNYPVHPNTPLIGSEDSSMASTYSYSQEMNFEVSNFFQFNDWIEEDPAFSTFYEGYNPNYTTSEVVVNSNGIGNSTSNFNEGTINGGGGGEEGGSGKDKKQREKVAFKTKSEIEVLDDGFKWRKYGKKMVKNSPNPRNYYRCSVEGCPVKKRVERDTEDPMYVVTTYEGIHNHQGPTN